MSFEGVEDDGDLQHQIPVVCRMGAEHGRYWPHHQLCCYMTTDHRPPPTPKLVSGLANDLNLQQFSSNSRSCSSLAFEQFLLCPLFCLCVMRLPSGLLPIMCT